MNGSPWYRDHAAEGALLDVVGRLSFFRCQVTRGFEDAEQLPPSAVLFDGLRDPVRIPDRVREALDELDRNVDALRNAIAEAEREIETLRTSLTAEQSRADQQRRLMVDEQKKAARAREALAMQARAWEDQRLELLDFFAELEIARRENWKLDAVRWRRVGRALKKLRASIGDVFFAVTK